MTSVCNGEGICWEERESPTLRHQVAGTVVLNERTARRKGVEHQHALPQLPDC